MLSTVNGETNGASDFLSSLGLLLREIQLSSPFNAYKLSFEEFFEMANHLNGIPVNVCSGSEKLSIIKTFSRFVNDTQLQPVDSIKYRVLLATTHQFVISDDGLNRQLELDSDLLNHFKSLSREDQLVLVNLCAEYGRSDLEWVVANMADLKRKEIQIALRTAAENGHVKVLKWLHDTFGLTAEDAIADDNRVLRWVARNGHLEVLKWFGLTAEDARADDNYALFQLEMDI